MKICTKFMRIELDTLFCAKDNVVNSPTDKDRYKNYKKEA